MLSEQSLKHSMNLIKEDLSALGISHDNFVSEKSLVKKKFSGESNSKIKRK